MQKGLSIGVQNIPIYIQLLIQPGISTINSYSRSSLMKIDIQRLQKQSGIIGTSEKIVEVLGMIAQVAP